MHVRAQSDPQIRVGETFTISVVLSREQVLRATTSARL
jgi:hypothetical protein